MAGNAARMRKIGLALAITAGAAGAVFLAVKATPSRGVVVDAPDRTASRADPRFEEAYQHGLAAFRRGDAHAAAMAFETAAQLDPGAADARVNLGFALFELGSLKAARENFEAALTINPQQYNAYYGIAEALEAEGAIEQAAGAMNTFLYYVKPDDPFRRKAEAALWEWGRLPVENARAEADAALGAPRSAHDLAARDLSGAPAPFSAYKGKVLVLNLWASWCPPCRRELPSLDRLAGALDPDRFAVVGLSVDKSPDLVREYLSRIGVGFPNLWDEEAAIARGYFAANVYPTTYIIGVDGKVERRLIGYRDWSSDSVAADIASVFEESQRERRKAKE